MLDYNSDVSEREYNEMKWFFEAGCLRAIMVKVCRSPYNFRIAFYFQVHEKGEEKRS